MEGSIGLRKGAWCREEDDLLKACVERYGEGKWHLVPIRAGLNRCRKSCRLRWLNYLKPNIKRGEFSEDEVDLMIRMHRLLGNRWSLIAGRIPGRTANDVKNYWNTKVVRTKNNKHPSSFQKEDTNNDNNMIPKPKEATTASATNTHQVIKPHPRTFSRTKQVIATSVNACAIASSSTSNNKSSFCFWDDDCNNNSNNNEWWGNLLLKDKNGGKLENDMFDDEQDNWEGFFTDPTATWNDVVIKGGDGDLLIRTPTWDSDHDDLHLLDANLWDYS